MCKVLYIKANTKEENPRTFKLSDKFVEEYKRCHPRDEITTLDLSKEKIRALSRSDILSAIVHKEDGNKEHPVLKYAWQFAEADKYIVAEPLNDTGIPSILNYIDYVSIMDIAFKYTAYGSVGLLKGKKAVNIVSRGGSRFASCSNELAADSLQSIFTFFGITDFTTINADALNDLDEEADLKARMF
jgi:Acyl carrier protein phosphodiesterase